MVDQIAVVNFTTRATVGDQDVTSPLITESFTCAILIYSRMTTEGSNVDTGVLGMGFISDEGDGGGTRFDGSRGIFYRGSAVTSVPDALHSNHVTATAKCISTTDATGTAETVAATYVTAIPGGFRINLGTVTAGQQVRVTAIIFAGLARSSIGTFSSITASSSHEDVGASGVGFFEPDLLVLGGADGTLALGSSDGTPQIGLATRSPLAQITSYLNLDDGVEPSDADGFIRTDSCSAAFNAGGRTVERAVISSFDSTGFNHQAVGATHNVQYIALKFTNTSRVRVAIANQAIGGSTGVQSFNAFGFSPDIVLGMSTLLTSLDTVIDGPTAAAAGYFVTGRYASYAYSAHHEEGQTVTVGNPANAHSRQGEHALLTLDHLGNVAQQASWVGPSGSGGFNLDFSTATAGYMTALGIQIIPTSPILRRRAQRGRDRHQIRHRLPLIGTRQIGSQPMLLRVLREVARMRRRMRVRQIRRTYAPPGMTILIGAEVDETVGLIVGPGMVRGEVSGAPEASVGLISGPGMVAGAIVGSGLPSEEP